jgi:hypothetical protein
MRDDPWRKKLQWLCPSSSSINCRHSSPNTLQCQHVFLVLRYVKIIKVSRSTTDSFISEARHNAKDAPISIYLGGGPGETSLYGAVVENGPCVVNSDSNSTKLNPWSWNNHVNMLFIDQPVQVGFSYDTLVNGTLDLFSQIFTPTDDFSGVNATNIAGTYPSQNLNTTASTSAVSSRTLWHFAQVWFSE